MANSAELELLGAQRQVREAQASLSSAKNRKRKATLGLLYRWGRDAAARWGVAAWAAGLIAGGILALIGGLLAIFLFGGGLGAITLILLFGFVGAGGAVVWLLRELPGENRADALSVAKQETAAAATGISLARAALAIAKRRDAAAQAVLASAAYARQREMERLLSIDPGQLHHSEFERYVSQVFVFLGFTAHVIGGAGDQGVDILACKGAFRVAVQAKRYIGSVSNSAVQEAYAGKAHHRCHCCMVITTGQFTRGAMELAASTGCILIGPERIPALVRGEIRVG